MPESKQNIKYNFRRIVLQPTSSCNLNCTYCYLPYRKTSNEMSLEVASAIALGIDSVPHPISLIWHGGEPMALGIAKFRTLLSAFSHLRLKKRVSHNIQTNGTLLNDEWCELLAEEDFSIGISLDGNEALNQQRVTWGKKPSYEKVIRGIEYLNKNSLAFTVIAVVSPGNIDNPQEFYDFFVSLGCRSLNVNIEEKEGLNRNSEGVSTDKLQAFWLNLFEIWKQNPVIKIREFDMALGWMNSLSTQPKNNTFTRDFFPTVAYNGDVVVLSPEFISVTEAELENFIVGNVLVTPLPSIVQESINMRYVKDFFLGTKKCMKTCSYYSYCGGGQASNKYFELNDIRGTETAHCRNSKQYVVDAILKAFKQ